MIDKVFNKKRADDRKGWLEDYDKNSYLDTNHKTVLYEDFINKELIHFSTYDCARSIPNMVDGLKTSLRKILFCAFKRKLTAEVKVAQFSGYVSEHSAYHHGEASLNGAIVNMAQNFVGSNNINLLEPIGQFGSRLQGGDDSASERYIFTQLNKITRILFPQSDDKILKYLNDDGLLVEPIYYAPIIPMILVNGTKGIGTGFSTDIMSYNPLQIINYLKSKLNNEDYQGGEFVPYYEGFKGTIIKLSNGKFLIKGKYEIISPDKIRVTELPIGYWTEDFKELLEELIEPAPSKDGKKTSPIIKDYDDMSKDTNVDFTITFAKGMLESLESEKLDNDCNGVEKLLKLFTTNTTTNMHLFNAQDKLKKYEKVEEIIDDYYVTRLEMYQTRKNYLIASLEKEVKTLSNKARYITEILEDTIDLRKKKKEQIVAMLLEKSYDLLDGDEEYKYLIKMPMDSVTEENVEKLYKERTNKIQELDIVKATTNHQMWSSELDNLLKHYLEYKEDRERLTNGDNTKQKKKIVKGQVILKKSSKPKSIITVK
jgi:DNA topoisomerase-2